MCTAIRFSDDKGNLYFARNLDWSQGYGERVVVAPEGYAPFSPFKATPALPHPVIGMGIVEKDTPLYFDCANTEGLACAGLNFPGYAQYEKEAVPGKTNVASWELPLWIVANFTTVDEAEAALKDVAVVDSPIVDKYPTSLLHWIVGDGKRSIAVEYTQDGMQIFTDDVDVLANQPGSDGTARTSGTSSTSQATCQQPRPGGQLRSHRMDRVPACAASRATTTRLPASCASPTSMQTTLSRRRRRPMSPACSMSLRALL